jgi:hypothetical protein
MPMPRHMLKTLRFTPLPAVVHFNPTTNTVVAEINMVFTVAAARQARHRAEEEAAADEARRLSAPKNPRSPAPT